MPVQHAAVASTSALKARMGAQQSVPRAAWNRGEPHLCKQTEKCMHWRARQPSGARTAVQPELISVPCRRPGGTQSLAAGIRGM
mmetsp:Transcript_48062/g.148701  ORF Transcript_48062/g.148701 Transcript_48062/m.148701 type:complete len:84 (+) Transcript_48062:53-304(+)